jgi:hypothetical protein
MRGSTFSRLLLVAGVAFTAACVDSTNQGPTATSPDAFLAKGGPAACDYAALRNDARTYLSNTDIILDLIRLLDEAERSGDAALFYDAGLNVLARLAAARNAGIAQAPAAGASLALGTLKCINATPLPTLAELTGTLGTDANGGVFEVLGGPNDPTGPAIAANAVPLWGAEPQSGGWTQAVPNQRFILYAYRITFATFTNEDPALLDPESEDEFGTAFEMRSIPANFLTNLPLVGVCVENPNEYRMQWQNNILTLQKVEFCDPSFTPVTATRSAPRTALAVARRALEWLAPAPLHASALAVGGTAGLPSGFTPFGAVKLSAATVKLDIDRIANGNRRTPMTITVRATSAKGNPVDNVLITLSVAGNNGLGSDGEYELLGVEGPTANGGVVTFNVLIDKAGSFTVRADGYFNQDDALPTLFALSNRFKIGS